MFLFHFTTVEAAKAISSQIVWIFEAHQPPDPQAHPAGAYFTTLHEKTPNLAKRLRIPRSKIEYYFRFLDAGDLKPLPGGRGAYILYSEGDYLVPPLRQRGHGRRPEPT